MKNYTPTYSKLYDNYLKNKDNVLFVPLKTFRQFLFEQDSIQAFYNDYNVLSVQYERDRNRAVVCFKEDLDVYRFKKVLNEYEDLVQFKGYEPEARKEYIINPSPYVVGADPIAGNKTKSSIVVYGNDTITDNTIKIDIGNMEGIVPAVVPPLKVPAQPEMPDTNVERNDVTDMTDKDVKKSSSQGMDSNQDVINVDKTSSVKQDEKSSASNVDIRTIDTLSTRLANLNKELSLLDDEEDDFDNSFVNSEYDDNNLRASSDDEDTKGSDEKAATKEDEESDEVNTGNDFNKDDSNSEDEIDDEDTSDDSNSDDDDSSVDDFFDDVDSNSEEKTSTDKLTKSRFSEDEEDDFDIDDITDEDSNSTESDTALEDDSLENDIDNSEDSDEEAIEFSDDQDDSNSSEDSDEDNAEDDKALDDADDEDFEIESFRFNKKHKDIDSDSNVNEITNVSNIASKVGSVDIIGSMATDFFDDESGNDYPLYGYPFGRLVRKVNHHFKRESSLM